MGLDGKKPEHLEGNSKAATRESLVILDATRQGLRERKRQQDLGLGPDIEKSDAHLVEQYQFLLRSVHFQHLDRVATSNKQIILEDSSDVPGQPTDYALEKHRIRVPLKTKDGIARPLADVRAELLYELGNASVRGSLERTKRLIPSALGPDSFPEEKEIYLYEMAAFALSAEWNGWINTIEHYLRVQAINADSKMGEGGPHVTRRFEAGYAKVDQRWYDFTRYIKWQIMGEHTTRRYDPEAAKSDWVGKRIVAAVQARNPASLIITQKQVRDWQNGIRTKVKSPSNNPFNSRAIIEQAMKDAQLARASKAAKAAQLAEASTAGS